MTLDFEEYREITDQKNVYRHREALYYIKKLNIKHFLDMWCWDGFFLNYVKKEIWIIGEWVDISIKGINKTKTKKFKAYIRKAGDKLPFIDKYFDICVALDVLEHLYSPDKFLQEAHRVCKKWIIISVPNFNSITARIQVLFWKVPENNKSNKLHCYWYNKKVLTLTLQKNWFKIEELKTNTLLEKLYITRLLAKILPSIFGLSFLIYATKIESFNLK